MAVEHIPVDEYGRRIRALLGPGGLDSGLPRKLRDRWILLHAVASRFGSDERLNEIGATARIGEFLTTAGMAWKIDRAALRRALVDEGFLERDPPGTAYWRSSRHRSRVTFDDMPGIAEILATEARPQR